MLVLFPLPVRLVESELGPAPTPAPRHIQTAAKEQDDASDVTEDGVKWASAHAAFSVGAGATFVWLVVGATWWCCKPDAKEVAKMIAADHARQDEAMQLVLQRGAPRSAAAVQQYEQQCILQPGDVSYHGDDDI